MVSEVGTPTHVGGSWAYVSSADPYGASTIDQQAYAHSHVLPFLEGKDVRLAWGLVPSEAAILISFVKCVPCVVHSEESASVCLLPGDRSLLLIDGEVVAYNSSMDNVLYVGYPRGKHSDWISILNALKNVCGREDSTYNLWQNILRKLTKDYVAETFTEDHRARIRWELRMQKSCV